MANDLEPSDDVSAMMEALWGPRTEAPAHVASGPGNRSHAGGPGEAPHDVDSVTNGPVVPHAQGDIHQELALIESWERESTERLAALEHAVGSELERLTRTVESSHAELAATADLHDLRREVRAEMVEQLRLVLDEALKQGDARTAVVAAELSRRQEALVGKDEFAVLRSELSDELSRNVTAAHAELQQRAALLGAAVVDARTHMGERLDQMAALVSTEAARAAEQATARAGIAAETLHRELGALRAQVQQISTVVAALQRRLPPS